MIVLEPHALKRRMLLHISSTPAQGVRVQFTNSRSNQFFDYGNAAEPTEVAVTLLYLELRFRGGIPRLRSRAHGENKRGVGHVAKAMYEFISLAPEGICPGSDGGNVRLVNKSSCQLS